MTERVLVAGETVVDLVADRLAEEGVPGRYVERDPDARTTLATTAEDAMAAHPDRAAIREFRRQR